MKNGNEFNLVLYKLVKVRIRFGGSLHEFVFYHVRSKGLVFNIIEN